MNVTRRQFTAMAASAVAYTGLSRLARAAAPNLGAGSMSAGTKSTAAELTQLSLADAAAGIRAGKFTSAQLVEACLGRIAIFDPKLDAFITVMKTSALAQSKELDEEAKAGRWRGPLHGVPIALKDNIDTAGTRTTAASAVFEDRVPNEDAPVVARLKAAGAVILGKTNLEEFAMGAGDVSYYGPSRNPWNLAHNSGGSSSGSGAAIAAELCFGALGTDTGGSIRCPSSFCGIVGFKPTYGLVPIRGIVPLTVSLDHCGPMTRTVRDAALMLNVMAGYDRLDITSVEHPKEDYVATLDHPVGSLRLATVPAFYDRLHPDVSQVVGAALEVIGGLTKGLTEGALPGITHLGNLSALGETYAYHEPMFKQVPTKYLPRHRARLESYLASNVRGHEYVQARWQLELLRRTVDDAFANFDLVVVPTVRILPPDLKTMMKAAAVPTDIIANTQPFNIYGLPALTVPCGWSKSGLPIGLTIAGPRFSEGRILALANAFERATEFHTRRPSLTPDTPKPDVE